MAAAGKPGQRRRRRLQIAWKSYGEIGPGHWPSGLAGNSSTGAWASRSAAERPSQLTRRRRPFTPGGRRRHEHGDRRGVFIARARRLPPAQGLPEVRRSSRRRCTACNWKASESGLAPRSQAAGALPAAPDRAGTQRHEAAERQRLRPHGSRTSRLRAGGRTRPDMAVGSQAASRWITRRDAARRQPTDTWANQVLKERFDEIFPCWAANRLRVGLLAAVLTVARLHAATAQIPPPARAGPPPGQSPRSCWSMARGPTRQLEHYGPAPAA